MFSFPPHTVCSSAFPDCAANRICRLRAVIFTRRTARLCHSPSARRKYASNAMAVFIRRIIRNKRLSPIVPETAPASLPQPFSHSTQPAARTSQPAPAAGHASSNGQAKRGIRRESPIPRGGQNSPLLSPDDRERLHDAILLHRRAVDHALLQPHAALHDGVAQQAPADHAAVAHARERNLAARA